MNIVRYSCKVRTGSQELDFNLQLGEELLCDHTAAVLGLAFKLLVCNSEGQKQNG